MNLSGYPVLLMIDDFIDVAGNLEVVKADL